MRESRVRFGPEIFRIQRYGGVNRYIIELHRGLLARAIDSQIVAGLHRSPMLDGAPAVRGRQIDRMRPRQVRQALSLVVDRGVARREQARLGPKDVWHPSYFAEVRPGRSLVAVTVYDMVHERFPEGVSPRDRTLALKAPACRAADVIFCISADTAADVHERIGIPEDRLVVTHLGVRPVTPLVRPSPFGDRPYVVYVGNRRPRYKNWSVLLDAIRIGPPELALLCIGAPPDREDKSEVARRGLLDRVRFEGGSDEELAGRYRDAAGLMYPSLYEGFGLPPLEALAQGCPVVATAVGAIPEIVGDVAMLVEPTIDGLGHGLVALLRDGPEVARQRLEGPGHAARFSWLATVEATAAGYRRALDHCGRP